MYDNDDNAVATAHEVIANARGAGGPVGPAAATGATRIAIYATGFAKGRRDPSVARQVVACQRYARSIGGKVVRVYVDRPGRDSDVVVRSARESMLRGAEAGLFEMLVIEDPDRLSHDLVVLGTLIQDLHRHGGVVHVVAQGVISLADVTVRGLLTEETRKRMIERTRFGLVRMAEEGRFPSRPCFGYGPMPGDPRTCLVDPRAAATVRRIFTLRGEGLSIRAILTCLREDGAVDARGQDFSPRTVRSMLRNPRYTGLLMYNRRGSFVDPRTGRKRVCPRPPSEWVVTEVPAARIVDRPTWDRVQLLESADGWARRRRH